MKPNWDSPDCPKWANYLAMDDDGGWFWFQNKPAYGQFGWMTGGGMYARVRPTDCGSTLEERPVHKSSFV